MRWMALLALIPLTVAAQSRDVVYATDTAGYEWQSCAYDYVDLQGDVTPLPLMPADTHNAGDEGAASLVLASGFRFYGRMRSNLTVSSNGYLAFDEAGAEDGADFRASCPLPAVPTNSRGSSARIYALQGDLDGTQNGNVYAEFFADCPRQDGACTVVQWSGWGRYQGSGNLDFQAILYHDNGNVVLQYADLGAGVDALTVGVQDDRASTGATLQCGAVIRVEAGQSWCLRRDGALFSDRFGAAQ